MNLSQSILEALQANADLTAAVSTRIFSGVLPTGRTDAYGPWLVFTRISNVQETGHDGDQALARARYQFTIGSNDKAQIDAVRDILVAQFNGVNFTALSGQQITFLHGDDHEHYEADPRTYTAIVDLFVWANT